MPANLVEDPSSYPATITVPVGSDPRNAASVRPAFQNLADRLAWIKALITSGMPRVRWVSAADLIALTGMSTGDIAVVRGGSAPLSIVTYASGSSATDNPPYVYTPTAGGGRWLNVLNNFLSFSAGVGDANARWTIPTPKSVLAYMQLIDDSPETRTIPDDGDWQNIPSMGGIVRTMAVGEVVEIRAPVIWSVTSSEQPQLRLHVTTPGGASGLAGSEIKLKAATANIREFAQLEGRWTATEAGDHLFRIQGQTGTGGGPFSIDFHSPRVIRGIHYRA